MPRAPRRCPAPGCTNLIRHTPHCEEHTTAWRGRTTGQGSTRQWRTVRQQVLERDHYRCRRQLAGCTTYADEVNHLDNIATTGQARAEALNPNRCEAICHHCHQILTQHQARAGRNRWKRPAAKHPGLR